MTWFIKLVVLLIVFQVIIITLNGNSHRVSVQVIEHDIRTSYYNQLRFFMTQVDNQVDQLAVNVLELEEDPTIKQYMNSSIMEDLFDANKLRLNVLQKIKLQSASTNWPIDISIYSEERKEVISTRGDARYDDSIGIQAKEQGKSIWRYKKLEGQSTGYFYTVRLEGQYLIEAGFSDTYIRNMLDNYEQDSKRTTFLYHPSIGFIGAGGDYQLYDNELRKGQMPALGSHITEIAGQPILVSAVRTESLDWYLIDYIPLSEVVLPIQESRNFFVLGTVTLLFLGIMIALFAYRQVQIPINQLGSSIRDIRIGNYSSRLDAHRKDEFEAVFTGFNSMAERIQVLIETVYEEKLRTKEAELKQLQSQINPHFLYNCLFYIKNMAKMGAEEEVVAMALNLGEYYRYTTRLENPMAALAEELQLVRNYLTIQSMRAKRFQYEIQMEEGLYQLQIPRLLLQPLVENAIIHGIAPKEEGGLIRISGNYIPGGFVLRVEDAGVGLDEAGLEKLRAMLKLPLSDESGCGTWNTHQRVINIFEEGSGVEFEASELGGLRVTIRCITHQEE
jgi:two-component system sensor histidine kinase YesM